jgi:hypothetical protein
MAMDQRKILWLDFQVGELPRQSLLVETAKQIGSRIEELTELSHPRFLRDIAVERKNGKYYLGRETVAGLTSLAEYLQNHTVQPEQFGNWLLAALDVLNYIHQAGIFLYGITLDNIYLSPTGELYLADAKPRQLLSTFTPISDTEEYLAPEVLKGQPSGAAADIWSLGVVAYRACCGVFPFADKEPQLVSENIAEREPLDPRYHNPKLSASLAKLILSLLTKEPAQRPTATAALLEAHKLAGFCTASPREEAAFAQKAERKVLGTERSWQRKRFFRNNWGWFAGGLVVLLIGISLFRSGQTESVITAKTTPLEVVKIYYRSLNDLDVIAMEQAIDKKVGKQTIDMVSRLHVIEKVNLGMQMQSGQKKEPAPDLVKVQELKIQGSQKGDSAVYTASYQFSLPAEGGGMQTTNRQDKLVLRKVEGKWRIVGLAAEEL